MKRVQFKSLYIKNFLSVGEEPVEIKFSSGFNIITGFNRDEQDIKNGVGKTLIIDALYFAIFGSTLRELSNQSYIINRQIGKNCTVRLEFENDTAKYEHEKFVIERSLAPKSLRITKDGSDKTKSSIPETNKYIREVLSADEDVFQNCVIMRANSNVPFMMKGKTAKKNFIESIFNLSIFSEMLKDVKESLRSAKESYDIINSAYQTIEGNKVQYESEIERLSNEAKKRAESAQTIITGLEKEIETYQVKLDKLVTESSKIVDYSGKIEEQQKVKLKADSFYQQALKNKCIAEAKIAGCRDQLDILDKDTGVCPTCKRKYDKSHLAHIETAKQSLINEIKKESNQAKEFAVKEQQLKEITSDINTIIQDLLVKQNEVRYINKEINDIKRLITSKQEQINICRKAEDTSTLDSFRNLLANTIKEIAEKKEQVEHYQHEINKLNICEHILGEYGIRAYIVNKLLELLNGRISHYLSKLKSTFKFSFNELFEDEIKDSSGMICSYGNCSGAEMKKIDLAISFAFLDIIKYQQQLEYNILFLDEILDSSLDTKSIEYVINFLSEYVQQNNVCLYLITHKSDINLPDITDYIRLVKENGFTTFPDGNKNIQE